MALSLLCGGLGVASAADGTVSVEESAATTGTAVVYTQEGTESYVEQALNNYDTKTQVDDKIDAKIEALTTTGAVATNKDNIGKLQTKTAKLSDDGTKLLNMYAVSGTTVSATKVNAGELKVTGKISDGTVNTTLADINDSMTQTKTNKEDIANLKTTTGDQDTAIKDLQKKTTNISYADGAGTSIDGITVKDGNIVGNGNSAITQLANVETDRIETDSINGKSLTGTNVATEKNVKDVADAVKAETDARTEADIALEGKITKNSENIATLDKSSVKYDTDVKDTITLDGAGGTTITQLKEANLSDSSTDAVTGKQLYKTNAELAAETTARTDKDMELEKGIAKNSGDITALGGKIKTNADNIQTNANNIKKNKDEIARVNGELVKTNEYFNAELSKTNGYFNSELSKTNNHFNTELEKTNAALQATNKRTGGITRNDAANETKIEGNVTVDNLGNVSAKGAVNAGSLNVTSGESNLKNTTVDGTLSVNKETTLNGKLTANDEATFTKKVTMENDLEVKGELKTDKIAMENKKTDADGTRYNSSTTITADGITHIGEVEKNGVITKSQFTHTEEGSETYATKGDKTDWTETHSDVKADGVKTEVKDSKGNRTNTSQTTEVINGFAIDEDGNSSTTSQTAKDINGNVTDKDGNKTDMKVTATENSIQIQDKDGKNTNLQVNTMGSSVTEIKNGDGKTTKTEQTATDITNTAEQGTIKNNAMNIENNASGNITNNAQHGTITNDAKNIVNNASENITTTAKTMDTTVTGKATESYGELDTTVNGMEKHTVNGNQDIHVTGKQTNTVESGQENIISGGQTNTITGGQINNITGNQTTIVTGGNISNKAEKITNEANTELTDKVGENTRVTTSSSITDTVGTTTNRKIEDGKITDTAGDSTVTTKDGEGTTFAKAGSAAYSTEAGATKDTNIAGNHITTGRVDANELGVSDKDGDNTADFSVEAGEDGGVKASASNGTTTGSLDVKGDKVESSVKEGDNGSTISQTKDTIESTVKDGDNKTSIKQTATDITNTAKAGTITNDAKDIVNEASKSITNKVGDNTSETMKDGEITTSIKDGAKKNTVISTADGTSFFNSEAWEPVTGASGVGTAKNTTIKGNTITTGKVTMDYADVMKDLGVRGNANITGKTTTGSLEVKGESKLTGNVTMENNATVGKNLTVNGITTTKTLKVTENAEIDGNATIKGDVTARSYKVGGNTYIDKNGIHANGQKITDVADGSISEGSKDAVNGGQLYDVKRDMEHKVDKVGANAAAMANLRPMEFDPSSKWNIAAAIGNYGSETAAAIGAFYRPNDNVMVNLSTAFGTGENMVGGGVSVRLGKGGNKLSREETNALKAQVADLTARMDALLSVLNPNMSKDFPDVPENHWAYEAVSRLAGNDIVQGYPDGEFHGERTMTRYEMAEIIYNALSRGAEAEKELVEEFKPELQAMAASEKATAERAEG